MQRSNHSSACWHTHPHHQAASGIFPLNRWKATASAEPVSTSKTASRRYLGSPCASLVLYLPNPPLIEADSSNRDSSKRHATSIDIDELIALNGNHWRKILTILAKLNCGHNDWRHYRDHQLLRQHEAVCFDDQLRPGSTIHLVAGKSSWQRLGLEPDPEPTAKLFEPLDDQQRLWKGAVSGVQGDIYLTPYFDYRQFPNALIELLKKQIA